MLCIPSRLENEKSQKVTEILPAAGGNPTSPAQKNTSLKETLMQFRGKGGEGLSLRWIWVCLTVCVYFLLVNKQNIWSAGFSSMFSWVV